MLISFQAESDDRKCTIGSKSIGKGLHCLVVLTSYIGLCRGVAWHVTEMAA